MESRSLKQAYHETKEKYRRKSVSRWWLLLWMVLFLLLIEVGTQMLYPAGLTRFNLSVDGLNISQKSGREVEELLLDAYQSQKVIIENSAGEQIEFSLTELGASINTDAQVTTALDYSFSMRFIPLSLFWPHNIEIYPETELGIDTNLAQKEPTNANIIIENSQLMVVEAQPGLEIGEMSIANTSICSDKPTLRIDGQSIIHCNIKALQPIISTDIADAVVDKVSTALQGGLTFNYQGSQEVEASFYDIVNWLDFTPNIQEESIDVVVDIDDIRGFLEKTELAKLNQSAENTNVGMINGEVTSQTTGKSGWGINYQGIVDKIGRIIDGDEVETVITLELAHIYPGTVYSRVFTDDFAGLSAELEHLYGDKNVAIVTIDLTGQGRNIYINQWKQFTAASTYKLYVAYSMLKSGGPPSCFEVMIINSDNACPQAWLVDKGLRNVENEVHEIGVSGVTYFGSQDMRTSAMDLANFLARIYRHELPIDNDRLINDMKSQRFRQGIPTGLGGNAVVADKVGFLWGLLHDAGIVYSNKGDYIQVILTDGYSWGTIAEISSRIYDKM